MSSLDGSSFHPSPEAIARGDRFRARKAEALSELQRHPSTKALARWQAVDDTFAIWRLNMGELVTLVDRAETDSELILLLAMPTEGERSAVRDFWIRMDQRLHNVVAATGTLIDRSRQLVRNVQDTAFVEEYERRRKSTIVSDPESVLLAELRDHILHNRHAVFRCETKFGASGSINRISISRAALLQDSKLGSGTRAYLSGLDSDPHLLTALRKYERQMSALHTWMESQWEQVMGGHLATHNKMRQAYDDVRAD